MTIRFETEEERAARCYLWNGAPSAISICSECGTKQFLLTVDASGSISVKPAPLVKSFYGTSADYEKMCAEAQRKFDEEQGDE